ncbi:MAG: DUF6232 family protein [Chloroflexia bacterium]
MSQQYAQSATEAVYYGDGSVWVTNERLVHGTRSYQLKGVKGARVSVLRATDQIWLFALSVFLGLGLLILTITNMRESGLNYFPFNLLNLICSFFAGAFILFLLGLTFFIPTIVRLIPREHVYAVTLLERFWRPTVLASTDRTYVERIAETIRDAIAHKLQRPGASDPLPTIGPPTPILNGNTLLANNTQYNLFAAKSVRLSSLAPFWEPLGPPALSLFLQLLFLFIQLFTYIDRHTGMLEPLLVGVGIALSISLLIGFVLYAFLPGKHSSEKIHTVVLTGDFGSHNVYATTSAAEAEHVKEMIEAATRQARAIPVNEANV